MEQRKFLEELNVKDKVGGFGEPSWPSAVLPPSPGRGKPRQRRFVTLLL